MRPKKTTPLFLVDAIEPLLPHWTGRLGYQAVAEVPHGAHLGFVILVNGGSEIMLQSAASVGADIPEALPAMRKTGVGFYHEVDDIDAAVAALKGLKVVAGPRTTDYG